MVFRIVLRTLEPELKYILGYWFDCHLSMTTHINKLKPVYQCYTICVISDVLESFSKAVKLLSPSVVQAVIMSQID